MCLLIGGFSIRRKGLLGRTSISSLCGHQVETVIGSFVLDPGIHCLCLVLWFEAVGGGWETKLCKLHLDNWFDNYLSALHVPALYMLSDTTPQIPRFWHDVWRPDRVKEGFPTDLFSGSDVHSRDGVAPVRDNRVIGETRLGLSPSPQRIVLQCRQKYTVYIGIHKNNHKHIVDLLEGSLDSFVSGVCNVCYVCYVCNVCNVCNVCCMYVMYVVCM